MRFLLVRVAKKNGGDRYESSDQPKEEEPIVIYVPQYLSREGKYVYDAIDITFEPVR